MPDAVMFWSSGKDSAATLSAVSKTLRIEALLTTVNRPERRVAVHEVPEELLDRQAEAMNLPLEKIEIPSPCPNDEYEARILAALRPFRERGIEHVVFGDIHLADIRSYREALLARAGMQGVFPLWRRDTRELAQAQIASGIRAVVTCVDNNVLSLDFTGQEFDQSFLQALPEGVDHCGENGEFHTFVYNAPVFNSPVPYRLAGTRDAGSFSYADIESAS